MEQNVVASEQGLLAPSRWARLLPLIFITYSLAYLDRVNFGFGSAGGLAQTLGITAGVSSLLSALFFLGYFFFQVPGAHYAAKHSARKLVFWALIAWGILASLQGVFTNIYLFAIDRFLLGAVEGVVLPAMLIFITHWFIKREKSRANTFLILGNPVTILWASIASGYLIQLLGWQWMFILEGIPSIIWAFVWLWIARDSPEEVKWLSRSEAEALEQALRHEQQGLSQVKNYWAAFRLPRVILLAAQYFFWSIGVYGFVLWLPSIIKAGSHLTIGITGLLSALPYLLAIILMLVASYYSDRTVERKLFVWPFLLAGAIAFYLSYLIGASNFWLSLLLLVIAGGCMYAPYGPFFAIPPEILPRYVSGEATALINSMGALGSFVGVYVVGYLNGVTGSTGPSFIFMAASLVLAVIFTIAVRMPRVVVQPVASSPEMNKAIGSA